MIRGIKFVTIPVRDQSKALAFYTEKLGFTIATDQPFGDGQRWIELRIPGAETRVTLFTPPGSEQLIGTFLGISMWADDVEATYRDLVAKGVEFVAPPKRESWGTSTILIDQDGNKMVLGSR